MKKVLCCWQRTFENRFGLTGLNAIQKLMGLKMADPFTEHIFTRLVIP